MSTTTRRDADAPGRRYTWPAGRRRAQAFNLGAAAGPRSRVSGRSWARLAPTGDRVDSVDMEGAEPRSPAVFVTVITTSGPGEWDRHKEEGLRPHRRPVARERCREPLCLTPCRGAMIRICGKRPSTCGPPGGGRPLGSAGARDPVRPGRARPRGRDHSRQPPSWLGDRPVQHRDCEVRTPVEDRTTCRPADHHAARSPVPGSVGARGRVRHDSHRRQNWDDFVTPRESASQLSGIRTMPVCR